MIGNIEAGVRELLEELIDVVPGDPLAPIDLGEQADDVVQELEERFGIALNDVAATELRSVSAITALVKRQMAALSPPGRAGGAKSQ